MNLTQLECMLSASGLELSRDGERFRCVGDDVLTFFVATGGELARFAKVEEIHLERALSENGLVALVRDGAYTVIRLESVLAVERGRDKKDKKRTGFV